MYVLFLICPYFFLISNCVNKYWSFKESKNIKEYHKYTIITIFRAVILWLNYTDFAQKKIWSILYEYIKDILYMLIS